MREFPAAATWRHLGAREGFEALAHTEVAPRGGGGELVHQISRSKGLGS